MKKEPDVNAWLAEGQKHLAPLVAERERLVVRLAELDRLVQLLRPEPPRRHVVREHYGPRTGPVIDYIAKNPGCSTAELISATGIDRAQLTRMVKSGIIHRRGGHGEKTFYPALPNGSEAGK